MSDLIKLKTLEDIEDKYNIFFIDLWGVIHNGLELFENVKTVLKRLKKKKQSCYFHYKCPKKILRYS